MSQFSVVCASDREFRATLSDGRSVIGSDLATLAEKLICLGMSANGLRFEWRAGQRMMTAGQQVALAAEMRDLARRCAECPAAA